MSKSKGKESATNVAYKKKQVINMFQRQITKIKTDLPTKGFNFYITLKTLPNKKMQHQTKRCRIKRYSNGP